MNIYEKLMIIQQELKAPKCQKNSFGNYKYRSCEDILESVKPFLSKTKTTLTITDELMQVGERYYIKAIATLYDTEEEKHISNIAYARESESKKGMDDSQVTGATSSYARKYALNGLFCIDDTKDADTDEYTEQKQLAENNKVITKSQEEALDKAIENRKLEDVIVLNVLEKYGYSSTSEIKVKDYMNIVNEFQKIVQK
jgi:hypothetical protein